MRFEDAVARLAASISAVGTETVGLWDALGRVLAQDVLARRTQPPFSASAMDGYAVRAQDLRQCPASLAVVADIAAGGLYSGTIEEGQCARIFTGAPLPIGADTIVIQENTRSRGDGTVEILEAAQKGAFVRPAGMDFREGQRLIESGTRLSPGHVSLAAAANYSSLMVRKRPRIGLLATGDELVLPGSIAEDGQIIASNSYGVGAILSQFGAEVVDLGIARDSAASLITALQSAQNASLDALITLGGASVGDHDLVRPTFIAQGMKLDFWKIAMRPGKPLMHGSIGPMHVLGLPGNPVSSLVCARIFGKVLVDSLVGLPVDLAFETSTLAHELGPNGPRTHFMRAMREGARVRVFDDQDSSLLKNFSDADVLAIRAANAPLAPAGSPIDVIALK